MKMYLNSEESKSVPFHWENKPPIDPDPHVRLFETGPRYNDGFGGPRFMEILHFGVGNGGLFFWRFPSLISRFLLGSLLLLTLTQ